MKSLWSFNYVLHTTHTLSYEILRYTTTFCKCRIQSQFKICTHCSIFNFVREFSCRSHPKRKLCHHLNWHKTHLNNTNLLLLSITVWRFNQCTWTQSVISHLWFKLQKKKQPSLCLHFQKMALQHQWNSRFKLFYCKS